MGKYRTIVADPPWEIGAFPEWGDGKGTVDTPYGTMDLKAIKALPVAKLAAPEAHLYLWTTTQFLLPAFEVAEAWGFEVMYPMVWCKPPRGIGLGGKFSSNIEFILFCRERHGALKITRFLRENARAAGLSAREINEAMGTSDMAGWWLSELPHRSRIPTFEQWIKLKEIIGFDDPVMDAEVEAVNALRSDPNKCDTRWWAWPRGPHSAKPEAFLDLVEQMSPAPRLEMFARRDRLGWDTWGNESLGTAELVA